MPEVDSVRCPYGCYIFGTTAAAEGSLNLLTNQHLDYDISEQHMMECNATYSYGGTCYTGGNIISSLYTNGYCFVDETTFPWLDSMDIVNPTCQPTGSAIFTVKTDTVFTVNATKRNLMIYGPIPTNPRSEHLAALVGFKRVMAGDTLRTNNGWGIILPGGDTVSDTLIIPENHPYVGRTAWTFKESRGVWSLESGYITKLAENDGLPYGENGKIFNGYVINCQTGDTIEPAYHDYDGDGYWNWGTGPKPAGCPGPDLEDCNDDDPFRLYYDDRMFCVYDCDSIQQLTSDVPVYINSDTTMYGGILTRPIIVNGYATLTMKGEFQCTPNVYIQGEINASIVLKSSLFFSVCGTDWIGFKLKANQDPADSLPIGRAYIGVRNSVISNAQCAIDGDSYALIYANKSDFINNKCDVYLHPHIASYYYLVAP